MKENEYKCAKCGGVFNKGWSDKEAKAECEGYFGKWADEDLAIICDDCFNEMHPDKYPELAKECKNNLTSIQRGEEVELEIKKPVDVISPNTTGFQTGDDLRFQTTS